MGGNGNGRGELSRWMKQTLVQQDLSHAQAGEKAGISHTTIGMIASGHIPSARTLGKLARAFGEDQYQLLRLAGFAPQPREEAPGESELLRFYRQLREDDRERLLAIAEALRNRVG